jgi:predicted MPP superfamily phosphohydrolase
MLLAYCPAYRDQLPRDQSIDLVLSGHTHGGQVQLFGFAPITPFGSGSYVEGWYRGGSAPMYVSRGVGMTAFAVRFECRPEVAFFDPQG